MGSAARRLIPYLARYRDRFVIGLLCVLVTTTIQLLSSTNIPQPVFDSMQAGARWAAQQLPPLTVREIVQSLAGLRGLKYAKP